MVVHTMHANAIKGGRHEIPHLARLHFPLSDAKFHVAPADLSPPNARPTQTVSGTTRAPFQSDVSCICSILKPPAQADSAMRRAQARNAQTRAASGCAAQIGADRSSWKQHLHAPFVE